MVGTVAFLILLIVGINRALSYYSFAYANGVYILVASLAVLASFILGYIGIAQLKRGSGTGGSGTGGETVLCGHAGSPPDGAITGAITGGTGSFVQHA